MKLIPAVTVQWQIREIVHNAFLAVFQRWETTGRGPDTWRRSRVEGEGRESGEKNFSGTIRLERLAGVGYKYSTPIFGTCPSR